MPRMKRAERDTFLAEPGIILRIAVVREDGTPLITPIWFIHEGGDILFTPRERSEWFDCLRRDPRISLCIDEDRMPYRKVLIEGTARLQHDVGNDDDWRGLYLRIAKRYVPDEAAVAYVKNTINEPRGLYAVSLADSTVRTWRMPLANEAAEGIWHSRYYQDSSIRFRT